MENLGTRQRGLTPISMRKLFISLYYIASYALILLGYHEFVVPIYGYLGFEWNPDPVKITESVFLSFLLPWFLPVRFARPSDLLLHLQLLFPILPMIVLYAAEGQSRDFLYITVSAFLLMVLVASKTHIKVIRITRISPVLFQRLLLGGSFVVIGLIIMFGGLNYLNFDLLRVYEFRSDSASNLPGIFGYLSPLVSKVLLPFSLLLAVINKDRFLALVAILGSTMMFGLTSHKGPLFYPFVVLAVYFVASRRDGIRMLLIGYLISLIVSLVAFLFEQGLLVGSLMLRRAYLVPAQLNYVYFDFFSSNPFYLWSQSKVTFGLLSVPYTLAPSHLIGLEYYNNEQTGANTGWIGSGYMNAGIIGVYLYSVIMGLLLALLNAYSKAIDKSIVVATIVAPMLAVFMSADLPTAFLNHGIILSLILFSMFSIQQKRLPVQARRIVC